MYELQSPNSKITVRPGNIVKLNRFDDECWIVNLGWFSYAGNRPINGWYLVSKAHKDKVKPLNLSDLEDIYVIEAGEVKEDYKELDPEIKKLIHGLKVQVEELSREVAQLTVEVEAKDEVIAEKGEEILELQRQIRELQRQIEELESQHRLDAETIATLNSQVTAQAQIIAEKAAEIRELTARVAELAEENELLTQQHQEDLATIAQQASTIQAQAESIASLTDDNNRLTDENDRLTEENTELVAQHQEDTATIAQQQETISSQGEQITELSGEVQELTVENEQQAQTIARQNTTIDQLNRRVPPLEVLEPINPSQTQRTYTPESPNIGFPQVVVNAPTAEGLGFREDYYKKDEIFLNKVGTYDPFPYNSVGGIYITEVDEDGYPVRFLIKNYERPANGFPKFFETSTRALTSIFEFTFENCPNITSLAPAYFENMTSLKNIIFPSNIKAISKNTFNNAGFTGKFKIPDTVDSISLRYLFGTTTLTEIELPYEIITQNDTSTQQFASGAYIEKVTFSKGIQSLSVQTFTATANLKTLFLPNSLISVHQQWIDNGGQKLENVTLENGFNCSIRLSQSTLYSHDTILSWFNALADRTGETAYTLTIGSTNLNKMTAEEKAIATNKNWNLA